MSSAWPPPPSEGADAAPPGYAWPQPGQPPLYPYPPPAAQPPWPGPYPPPYPPPYPYYVASPSTNGFAIAALVLGILWVYWIGSILAVVFGHIALVQTRERGQRGRGMAIAGLVLGNIGLAVLVAVILGAFVVGTTLRISPHSPPGT